MLAARLFRTPIIYPPYENMEMAAAISPVAVSPPLKFISPDDSNAAPINEMNTANRMEKDFFSLKNSIMVSATARGYMK